MAQGQRLTKQHKRYIAEVYHKYPDWVAKQVREKFHYHFRLKGDWPGLSAIQKALAEVRKADEKQPLELKVFDELWSLGSLAEHPIPPEAMPVVMSAYKKALAEKHELTIREALWIARLFKIIESPDLVWDWAWAYAMDEWLSKITNKPFDTTELDLEMVRNPRYAQEGHRESLRETDIWGIAEKYSGYRGNPANRADFKKVSDLFNKLMALNLSIEETEEDAKSGKYKKEAKQNERTHSQQR